MIRIEIPLFDLENASIGKAYKSFIEIDDELYHQVTDCLGKLKEDEESFKEEHDFLSSEFIVLRTAVPKVDLFWTENNSCWQIYVFTGGKEYHYFHIKQEKDARLLLVVLTEWLLHGIGNIDLNKLKFKNEKITFSITESPTKKITKNE